MNPRRHNRLTHMNRLLILALTVGGLLMDGLQAADLPCTLALFIWLWLPLCTRLEARLLRWAARAQGPVRPERASPSA